MADDWGGGFDGSGPCVSRRGAYGVPHNIHKPHVSPLHISHKVTLSLSSHLNFLVFFMRESLIIQSPTLRSLCVVTCVCPVIVRCWPGRVHRSIASFTPVRAEWPCQPRATSKMSRLEVTRYLFQVGVSKRMKVLVVSLLQTEQTEFLFLQQSNDKIL